MRNTSSDFPPHTHSLFQRWFPWNSIEFRKFLVFLLAAMLIRFLFMPFFGHIDFLSESRRVFRSFDLGGLYPGSRFVTSFIQQINFTLFSPLIAEKSSMFQQYDWDQSTASFIHFFGFSDHHAILRTFFIIKIPFLVFDLLIGFTLFHFFTNKTIALKACFIWFFNPITIFAFYIYGRYESIPLLFIMLMLLALKHDKVLVASLFMGLAIWAREFNLILFPLIAIYIIRYPKFEWTRTIGSLMVVAFFIGMASNILPEVLGFVNDGKKAIGAYSQAEDFLGFPMLANTYYAFIIAYSMIGMWMFLNENLKFQHLLTSLGLFYISFFFLAKHSVHYVSWSMVVFAILSASNLKFRKGLWMFFFCWFVFWLVATDLAVFTQWLAAPASLFFVNLPTLPNFIEEQVLSGMAIGVGHLTGALRSVYVAALVICSIHLLSQRNEDIHE